MFVIIAQVLIKHSKKKLASIKNEKEKVQKKRATGILKTLISIVSVMIMFGLSWVFGAFSISEAAQIFQWFFVIFNTTQGFMLFVFFCVIGSDARDEWKNLLTCDKYKKKKSLTAQMTSSVGNTNSHSGYKQRSKYRKTIGSGSVETALTSDGRNTYTIKRSTGLHLVDSDEESEPLPIIEMAPFYKAIVDAEEEKLSGTRENDKHIETSLVIDNEYVELATKDHDLEKPKSKKQKQLPPHMRIKLKHSNYTVETIKYNSRNQDPEKIDLSREIYDDDDVFSQDAHDLVFSNCTQDSLTDSIVQSLEPEMQNSFLDSIVLSNESLYSQEQSGLTMTGLTDELNGQINDSSQCVLLP